MSKPKRQKDRQFSVAPSSSGKMSDFPSADTGSIPVGATNSMLDRTRSTMGKACIALDSCVDRVTAMLSDGDYDKDLASHLAWLTKQLAGVTDALRKLEAHDAKTVGTMSPEKRDELVMAYLQSLTPERRASVIAKLQAMQAQGGLLA